MTILDKEVWINMGTRMDRHYEERGYEIPRYKGTNGIISVKRGTKILVKLEDVPKNSALLIRFSCDYCNGENQKREKDNYKMYYKFTDGERDCCSSSICTNRKAVASRKINIPKNRSVGEKFPRLISEWSSENKKTPFEHLYGSEEFVWWNCSDCDSEYEMMIVHRTRQNCGCPYCAGKRVNKTNSLWTTHPEVAKLLVNPDRGHNITSGRSTREKFKCNECGYIENKVIQTVVRHGFSCPKCSDGRSYPEKFVFNLLSQLNMRIERQKTFKWSIFNESLNPKLNTLKKYDFYLPELNSIIETHGEQHYEANRMQFGRGLNEEIENDLIKEKLAKLNGISEYIAINCSKSEPNFIKENILKSKLNGIVNLSDVNWENCHSFAISSLVKSTCDLWGEYDSVADISEITGIDKTSVRRYLTICRKIGLCNYNGKVEADKTRKNNLIKINEINRVKVVQLSKEGQLIKEWSSIQEASDAFVLNNITATCRGRQKTSGGFKWMYKEDYDKLMENNSILV